MEERRLLLAVALSLLVLTAYQLLFPSAPPRPTPGPSPATAPSAATSAMGRSLAAWAMAISDGTVVTGYVSPL